MGKRSRRVFQFFSSAIDQREGSSPILLTPISTLGGTHASGRFFPGLRLPREDAAEASADFAVFIGL